MQRSLSSMLAIPLVDLLIRVMRWRLLRCPHREPREKNERNNGRKEVGEVREDPDDHPGSPPTQLLGRQYTTVNKITQTISTKCQ